MKFFGLAIVAVLLSLNVWGQTLRVDGDPFASCSMCMECSCDNYGKQYSRIVVTSNFPLEKLDVKGGIVVSQKDEVGRKIVEFLPNHGQKITFYAPQCRPLEVEVSEFVTGGTEYKMHIVFETNVSPEPVVEPEPTTTTSPIDEPAPTISTQQSANGTDLDFTVGGVTFKMKYVQGGTFQMGATSEQGDDAYENEKPVHTVTISKDYYIGETEVTQGLWKAVMGSNPSWFKKGDNYPVEEVPWDDCKIFIDKLNQQTGQNFRLPTEAEWEYAARGGSKSRGYKYRGSNTIKDVAWFDKNSRKETHPVKSKSPNELGLYDMSGNVYEWCQEGYGDYSSGSVTDPTGPSSGENRVLRGGSWGGNARFCRVSYRGGSTPSFGLSYYGLRLALVP